MRELAKGMFADIFFAEYFFSTEDPSESSPIVYRPELDHLIHIRSVNARSWRTLNPQKGRFKASDAYWLFFYAVTEYYETIPSTDDQDVTVKQ
jgi:hypothetical protein